MIGMLHTIFFTASANKQRTFTDLTVDNNVKLYEHEVISQKSVIEFGAVGLREISLNMRFSVNENVNPFTEIMKLRRLQQNGTVCPLVIGAKYYGKFLIESVNESHQTIGGNGALITATVSVKLKEYN